MIHLTKGQAKEVVLTLKEKTTLTSPVYLFRFVNDTDKKEYAFIAADTSQFKYRYNLFTITEGATVTLPLTGLYTYYVYEQSSATNLDYKLAGVLVEQGKLKVTGPAAAETVYTITEEIKVYNG